MIVVTETAVMLRMLMYDIRRREPMLLNKEGRLLPGDC